MQGSRAIVHHAAVWAPVIGLCAAVGVAADRVCLPVVAERAHTIRQLQNRTSRSRPTIIVVIIIISSQYYTK
jgi:hypothetical protein